LSFLKNVSGVGHVTGYGFTRAAEPLELIGLQPNVTYFLSEYQFLPLKRPVILKVRSLRLKDPENAKIFHVRLRGNSAPLDFSRSQSLAAEARIN
jgi:hypothetical protein